MQGGISSKRFSERSVGSVPSVCPTHTFKPTPVFSSDQFNQSVFVENFERVDQATSKEEIATKATAIIINGDLGSLTARICGVYRAAKGLCCAWFFVELKSIPFWNRSSQSIRQRWRHCNLRHQNAAKTLGAEDGGSIDDEIIRWLFRRIIWWLHGW